MKALLINPADQSVETVDVADKAGIASLIGFDTIESDEIGPDGDRLYFDEECFLRGDAVSGRFQIKGVAPVAGKGIVVGSDDSETPQDVVSQPDELLARITWL